jgi:hypothetical protein
MKKIIPLFLVLVMALTILLLPTSAAKTNANVNIKYIATPPKVDGVVKPGEYGEKIHSVDYSKDEFIADYDKDKSIKADFYAACDKNYLYMAWVVKTDVNKFMTEKDYDNKGDGFTEADLGYMWMYSCVQFIITPGAPKSGTTSYQTGSYAGDYLEVGLAITEKGESRKTAWNYPKAAAGGLKPDAWDFSGKRDETAKTTTYEVRIPWNKSGILKAGENAQFGLTYAIGDQVDFNVENNMCEWQDGILGTKQADNGAVVTLKGFPDNTQIDISLDVSKTSSVTSSTVTSSTASSSVTSSTSVASSSVASSSTAVSSKSASSAPQKNSSSEAPSEEENDNTLLYIIIAAVVVIGGGVAAYFIIAKKKKQ